MKEFRPVPFVAGGVLATVLGLGLFFAVPAFASGGSEGQTRPIPRNVPLSAPISPLVSFIPIQAEKSFLLDTPQLTFTFGLYHVPAGMRLVIEYVSFHYNVNNAESGGNVHLQLTTTAGGAVVTHQVSTLAANRAWSGESKNVTIYGDPGSTVAMLLNRNQRSGAHGKVTISGHLETVGSPGLSVRG